MSRTTILHVLAAAALASFAVPADAATAHNSQAGSYGPTSHICAPTPYFPTGGCASAAFQDDRRYPFVLPAEPYRRSRSPGPLDRTLPDWDD